MNKFRLVSWLIDRLNWCNKLTEEIWSNFECTSEMTYTAYLESFVQHRVLMIKAIAAAAAMPVTLVILNR